MREILKTALVLFTAVSLANISPLMAGGTNSVLAIVNGTKITSDQIEQLPGINPTVDFASLKDDKKAQIIVALINRQLVLEQAKKEGFDRSEPIANALDEIAGTYIVKQYLLKVAAGTDLSEEALSSYYKDNFLQQSKQYEIAHILLATEDEANKLIDFLKEGSDFSVLAKTKSRDRVSADKGGELGWLTSADMSPAFFKTVSGLSLGETSSQPTKTQFGWHIVKLIDKHESAQQAFGEVKQSIQQALIEARITAYLANLRDSAAIEIK